MCKIQGRTVCTCGSSQELVGSLGRSYDGHSGVTKTALLNRRLSSIDSLTSPSDEDAGSTFSEDDEDNTRTTDSSCVSAQEYWETGGESENDLNHKNLESVAYEERLSSDRFFPVRMTGTRSAEPRNRRKTKRKHHYPSKHSHHHRDHRDQREQDISNQCQSSEEEEKSSSYLALLTSEDEAPPARYDPEPADALIYQPLGLRNIPEPSYLDNIEPSPNDFIGLVGSNEPVTSDRGSWGMREAGDSNHRTAPCYSRYEDETVVSARSWYASEDDDVVVCPRSGTFSEPPPGPHLDRGGGDNGLPSGHTAVKVLMKNINTIKKKIKQFEEEFETAFGYRPSHSEKMKHKDIKKYMSELSKARKELKQMKDDVTGLVSVPSVFPLSLLRCQESTTPGSRPTIPGQASAGAASTLRQVEERLKEKRSACGRKENLSDMTCNELHEEKTALQKALLYYEYIHGRPKTREDRDLARPLYDRYRQCKRNVSRYGSRAKENMGDLAPILEHETMDFTLASPQHRGSIEEEEEEEVVDEEATPTTPTCQEEVLLSPDPILEKEEGKRASLPLGDLHSLPLHELKERKREAREEKKKLRRALRDFEEQFEREFGRKVQKEDRGPQEQTYLDYKHSKAKLRLLEALLSKHEPTRY
ncbi:unnamed protein product [Meganyctiphanes norvegica]|uniref:FAM13A-like domain-containing protein n=1 Tax=Meganyctiphanes norvegica TaxID=48144 RepID=A0AAV2R0X0_MEGNR